MSFTSAAVGRGVAGTQLILRLGEGHRVLAGRHEVEHPRVVGQVGAHGRVGDRRLDSEGRQLFGRPDTRAPQQRRGLDRAAAQHDLTGGDLLEGTVTLDHHAAWRARPTGPPDAPARRSRRSSWAEHGAVVQIGEGGRHPSPFGAVHRERSDAGGGGIVVVVRPRIPELQAGLAKGHLQVDRVRFRATARSAPGRRRRARPTWRRSRDHARADGRPRAWAAIPTRDCPGRAIPRSPPEHPGTPAPRSPRNRRLRTSPGDSPAAAPPRPGPAAPNPGRWWRS